MDILYYYSDLDAYGINISSSKLEFDNDTIKSNRLYIPRRCLVDTEKSILSWSKNKHNDHAHICIAFRRNYDFGTAPKLNSEYVLSEIDIGDDGCSLFTFYNDMSDNLIMINPYTREITAHWNISFTPIEHDFKVSSWNWDNLRNWFDEFLMRFRETCTEVYFNK